MPSWLELLPALPWLAPFAVIPRLAKLRPNLSDSPPATDGLVSVIIPARNESAVIDTVGREVTVFVRFSASISVYVMRGTPRIAIDAGWTSTMRFCRFTFRVSSSASPPLTASVADVAVGVVHPGAGFVPRAAVAAVAVSHVLVVASAALVAVTGRPLRAVAGHAGVVRVDVGIGIRFPHGDLARSGQAS